MDTRGLMKEFIMSITRLLLIVACILALGMLMMLLGWVGIISMRLALIMLAILGVAISANLISAAVYWRTRMQFRLSGRPRSLASGLDPDLG